MKATNKPKEVTTQVDQLVVGNLYADDDLGIIRYVGKEKNRYHMFKVKGTICNTWFTHNQIQELKPVTKK
jgi:hypothetical protein